jgi:hypothetical protein
MDHGLDRSRPLTILHMTVVPVNVALQGAIA